MPAFTTKEQKKFSAIEKAIVGEITNELAAIQLQLSVRRIKRLKKKVREEGRTAIVHQLKGKQSNHHIEKTVKEKAVDILKKTVC